MAGNKDMDIILIDSPFVTVLTKNNTITSLDGYQHVKEKFTYMFDGIENLCMHDDELIGVPATVSIEAWEANQELLENLKLELPDKSWSWYDFYEYAKLARKDINADGIKDTYIIEGRKDSPPFLSQYNCTYIDLEKKKASFNNEEFKNLLVLWKKMWDEDLVADGGTFITPKIKDNIVFCKCSLTLSMGDRAIIYPPALLGGQKSYPAQLKLLCITSFSEKKDLAAEFLSVFCSKEAQERTVITRALYKDFSIYRRDMLNPSSSEKNIEIFKNVLKYSIRENSIPELRIYTLGIIGEYVSGMLPLEKAVTMIEDKANLILGE
ncbi:MAG TPA: extracellular solute-binding protein [Clostridiaceae bacterium]|nr:extracellular solute-binding protein [Clostridiaceae bacterium]